MESYKDIKQLVIQVYWKIKDSTYETITESTYEKITESTYDESMETKCSKIGFLEYQETLFLPHWAGIIFMVSGWMDSSLRREGYAW